MLAAGEDLLCLRGRRRPHLAGDQEAVELGLRQRVGAVELVRVLGRDHEEGAGQLVGDALHRDLRLRHRLEERRLGARRRPVDLVGQEDVGEDRAGDELEGALALVEDAGAGYVRRQEVRRALNAPELAADRRRDGPGEHRLPGAGKVLEEHMTTGHQAGSGEPHRVGLADDDALDVPLQPSEHPGRPLRHQGRGRHNWPDSTLGGDVLRYAPSRVVICYSE